MAIAASRLKSGQRTKNDGDLMMSDEIPQELLDILDTDAGKTHSRQGSVVETLAKILTRYDELRTKERW
jgi:hypothetical protein